MPKEIVHQHGGNPAHTFARLGLSPRQVLDFSVNINPLGPPAVLSAFWPYWQQAMQEYPDTQGENVTQLYSTRWHLSPETILPGNGAASLFYLVLGALRPSHVTVITPSFHEYRRAALAAGSEVKELPLTGKNGFAPPTLAQLKQALQSTHALILGQPNNPTGTLIQRDMLLELAQDHPHHWFLVDEAFIDFIDSPSDYGLLHWPTLPQNVLVFHSLTKFYTIPGLRLGAVIGHAQTIATLRRHQCPWAINGVADQAAKALKVARRYETRSHHWMKSERKRFYDKLHTIPGIACTPPTANFVLARWHVSPDLDDLLRALLINGFFVRDCRNFTGLEDNYFRFAIRKPQENDRLLAAITQSAESYA